MASQLAQAPRTPARRRRLGRREADADAADPPHDGRPADDEYSPELADDDVKTPDDLHTHDHQPDDQHTVAGNGQNPSGSDGDRAGMESRIGHALARHVYADFGSGVGDYEFYTVGSGTSLAPGCEHAAGQLALQQRGPWAQALRDKGGRPYFAYSHEPTQSSRTGLGGAEDFKDAFRKVVSVMRSHGATNVQYTWQMVGWSFAANHQPDRRCQVVPR